MGYDGEYLRGVALTTAVLTLPAVSAGTAWLFFLSSLPLIYYPNALGVNRGFKIIFHATLVACGIGVLTGTTPILMLSFSLMPAGFTIGRSLKRSEAVQDAFTKGILALGVTWVLAGILISALNQVNLYSEVLKEIDAGLAAAYDAYSKAPDVPVDVQAELQSAFTRIREVTPKVFPGVVAVLILGTVWINILLANLLLKKKGLLGWGDLSLWRLPDSLVWVFIAAGAMLFLPGELNVIGLNLMIVMVTLYFMQGFEVLNHFCLKWSVPNSIRVLIIFFLVIQAYGFILLALLGLADIWADFRKPKTNET